MDARLLDILVCPICKGPLHSERASGAGETAAPGLELVCNADRLAFPVRDGIPVMLVDEARRVVSGD